MGCGGLFLNTFIQMGNLDLEQNLNGSPKNILWSFHIIRQNKPYFCKELVEWVMIFEDLNPKPEPLGPRLVFYLWLLKSVPENFFDSLKINCD